MAKTAELLTAAAALGFPDPDVVHCARWVPDTHPNLTFDFVWLDADPDTQIPYRIKRRNGTGFTKIPNDDSALVLDPQSVDAAFTELMRLQRLKNLSFLPDLQANFPAVDFSVLNFSVVGTQLVVDISGLKAAQQTAAVNRLAASPWADKITLTGG